MGQLAEVIQAMRRERLVVVAQYPDDESTRQRRTRDGLLRRLHGARGRAAYLHRYDAMLRIVELLFLTEGCRLGGHPHLALKTLVSRLLEDDIDVERIVTVRHAAKKGGVEPTHDDHLRLEALETALLAEAARVGLDVT